MNSRIPISVTAMTLFAALVPVWLVAQDNQNDPKHQHYKLIDVGTLGGPQSYVNEPNNYVPVLNDRGTITGWADTPTPDPFSPLCFDDDCYVAHAFQWENGVLTDLGALPGGSSSSANWISPNGLIAGVSQNGLTDFQGPEFHAALWREGTMIDLGTLAGGTDSFANAVNSKSRVVGWAFNTIPDPFSMAGIGFQVRAFLWQDGAMHDLGTLGGTDAMAVLVNERGQAVGESYTNSAPSAYCAQNFEFPLTTGAFLWENGKMKNLGSFGGTCTFATDLNNRGEVVGLSTLTGDQFQHAFLWRNGSLHDLGNGSGGNNGAAIALNDGGDAVGWSSLSGDQDIHASLWKHDSVTDLGTVDGDSCSLGFSINATGQVVGISVAAAQPTGCDFSQTRAFLWQGSSMVDLNTLIPPDSALYLTSPETINDRGEIGGIGLDSNGDQHAFLLIPCDENHSKVEGCDYSLEGTTAISSRPSPVVRGAANRALIPSTMRPGYRPHFRGGAVGPRN